MNTKVKYIDNYIKKEYHNGYITFDEAGKITDWKEIKGLSKIMPDCSVYGEPLLNSLKSSQVEVNSIYKEFLNKVNPVEYYYPMQDYSYWMRGATTTATKEFKKDDSNKTEYHHIPWDVIEDVAEVLTEGEKKYPGDNWKKCTDKWRYLNAVDRHLIDWRLGETTDNESGQSHLVHVICNLLFLAKLEKDGKI